MQLASSSAAALEELEKNAADVVVSDMRMPGVDGRQLPSEIRRTYRQTVYLILSGHADSSSVKRTAGIAHQYLAMPCESTAGQEGLTSRNEAFGLDIRSEA
jgi:YesN/AraC family two-component response regulator